MLRSFSIAADPGDDSGAAAAAAVKRVEAAAAEEVQSLRVATLVLEEAPAVGFTYGGGYRGGDAASTVSGGPGVAAGAAGAGGPDLAALVKACCDGLAAVKHEALSLAKLNEDDTAQLDAFFYADILIVEVRSPQLNNLSSFSYFLGTRRRSLDAARKQATHTVLFFPSSAAPADHRPWCHYGEYRWTERFSTPSGGLPTGAVTSVTAMGAPAIVSPAAMCSSRLSAGPSVPNAAGPVNLAAFAPVISSSGAATTTTTTTAAVATVTTTTNTDTPSSASATPNLAAALAATMANVTATSVAATNPASMSAASTNAQLLLVAAPPPETQAKAAARSAAITTPYIFRVTNFLPCDSNDSLTLSGPRDLESLISDLVRATRPLRSQQETLADLFTNHLQFAEKASVPKEERLKRLQKAEMLLRDDLAFFTQQRLRDLLYRYRDLGYWDHMAMLMQNVVSTFKKIELMPELQYLHAFALTRRAKERDREAALDICAALIKSVEGGKDLGRKMTRDIYGMQGRINKDIYAEALRAHEHRRKHAHCEAAIKAYCKVYEIEAQEAIETQTLQNLYGAVNALTTMFAANDLAKYRSSIITFVSFTSKICGEQHGVDKMTDYFDVASLFEANVVGSLVHTSTVARADALHMANEAAYRLQELYTTLWTLRSTMNNLELIRLVRNLPDSGIAQDHHVDETEHNKFLFWQSYLRMAAQPDQFRKLQRWPALELRTQTARLKKKELRYIMLHPQTDTDEAMIQAESADDSLTRWKKPLSAVSQIIMSEETPYERRSLTISFVENMVQSSVIVTFPDECYRNDFVNLSREYGWNPTNKTALVEPTEKKIYWRYIENKGVRIVLGRGSSATVYAGICTDSQDPLAIKEFDTAHYAAMLTREVEQRISRSLQHKNVVKFWGFEQDLDGKCRLLMERVSGGSLTAMLYKYGPLLEQMNSLVAYTRQLAEAINYLHTQSVIHRDIKGDNVLVDTYTGVIKLADFNVSKRQSLMQTAFGTVIGTPNFMAPEAARGNWCPASDVWSLGCTVHQMITGLPPHHTKSSDTLQEMYMSQGVTAPTIASSLQAELRQLLQSCFQEEPTKRPSAAALLETPILRNAYSDLPQGDPSASVGSNGTQAAEGGGGGGGAPPDSPLSSSSSSMLAPPSALPSRSGRVSPGPMARRLSLAFSTPNGKQHRMSVADATEWDTAAIKQEISLHLIDCLKEEKADVVAKWTYVASRHLTAWAEKWRDHLPLLLGELVTVLEDTNATVSADAGGASDTHVDRRTAQRLATLVSDWQHLVDGEGLEQAASAACDLLVLFTREGEPPDGHALAEILRRRQTPPHWIFAIEQQLKDAGDALRQRLQRAAVDASATTRPPSAAAAVSTDMKRNAQFDNPLGSKRLRSDDANLFGGGGPGFGGGMPDSRRDFGSGLESSAYMSLLQHHMAFLDSQRSMLESLAQQWVSRQEELAIAQRPNETYPLSPTMPARGSVMVDPGLREFVSSNGLSPSVAEILAQHDITLDLLMTMNKSDLRETGLSLGVRQALFLAMERYHQSQQNMDV